MTELYLLEWKDQEPAPSVVSRWLIEQGFVVEGTPKVYANGTLLVECAPDPSEIWPQFAVSPQTPAELMAQHVQEVVKARAALLAIPEHDRSDTDRALLALIELVMFGFGVGGHG